MACKQLAILCAGPIGASGQESVDLAMVAGTFEIDTAMFFQGDGAFQLIKGQQPELVQRKNYSKSFSALEFYDVEHLYVCETSLNERNISRKDLLPDITILSAEQFDLTLRQYQHVIRLS